MFPVITLFTALVPSHTIDHFVPLRVPTFYSPEIDETIGGSVSHGAFAALASIIFFLQGSFTLGFPLDSDLNPEQRAWVISFVATSGCTSLFALIRAYPFILSTRL